MTEITESVVLETWSTPNCPFSIEYSRRLLDDIRLAVVDAFFSLPRGGAEIGGVLLGKYANGRVTILEYVPLECEHIFGPSFTLSPGDHGRLADIVSGASNQLNDLQPVGWYHSHTRSDIFLSDADLDIHNRYFPNSWQIALVLRPSTFQPVQAGFFFRESDGSIYAKASYQEFALDPLPVGQVPRGVPAPAAQSINRQPEPEGPVITLDAAPVATTIESEPEAPKAAEPPFDSATEPAPSRPSSVPPALPPLPRLELVPDPVKLLDEPAVDFSPEEAQEPAASTEKYQPYIFEPWVPEPVKTTPEPAPAVASGYLDPPTVRLEPEPSTTLPETEPPAPPTRPALEFDGPMTSTFDSSFVQVERVSELPLKKTEPAPAVSETAVRSSVSAEEIAQPAASVEPPPSTEIKPADPRPMSSQLAAEPPSFLQVEPVRPRRRLWIVGAAAVLVVLVVGGYQQRSTGLAPILGQMKQLFGQRSDASATVLTLPLTTNEEQGQLQIHWDGAAPAIAGARDGILQITDDGMTTDLPLDAVHLRSGVFTYVRLGEHVDARMTIQELDGTQVRTATSFYGALNQAAKTAATDSATRPQASEPAAKNDTLAKDNTDLRRQVDQLNKQMAEIRQQRDELTAETARLKSDGETKAVTKKQKSDLAQQIALLEKQHEDLTKQNDKLKAELETRSTAKKQRDDLAKQNAELQKQRDDLAKQNAKLKADLTARSAPAKQASDPAQLTQTRDDLLIQIAKLKGELAAQSSGGKTGANPEQNAEFSKQRYQLVSRVSQLESDLAVARSRAERLQRQLDEMRKSQTQRRLQNQSGDQ
jgi:proteasome lid subunit RPN8/RPN11